MRLPFVALVALLWTGCYGGRQATRDSNLAWQGRSRASLQAQWGSPARVEAVADGTTALVWTIKRHHVDLPEVSGSLDIDATGFDLQAEVQPGTVRTSSIDVVARIAANNQVLQVDGPSLRWGPPNDANLRWGLVMGMHAGMGRLDDTSTPLPSGGLYIGGMLSRTLAMVGDFSLVSGSDDAGGAMGFAWGLAAQYWTSARVWLRAGPAMVLAFDPGFNDPGLSPGVLGGLSYALIKRGTFVLDLRLDLTASTAVTFGSVGIGVNVN